MRFQLEVESDSRQISSETVWTDTWICFLEVIPAWLQQRNWSFVLPKKRKHLNIHTSINIVGVPVPCLFFVTRGRHTTTPANNVSRWGSRRIQGTWWLPPDAGALPCLWFILSSLWISSLVFTYLLPFSSKPPETYLIIGPSSEPQLFFSPSSHTPFWVDWAFKFSRLHRILEPSYLPFIYL